MQQSLNDQPSKEALQRRQPQELQAKAQEENANAWCPLVEALLNL